MVNHLNRIRNASQNEVVAASKSSRVGLRWIGICLTSLLTHSGEWATSCGVSLERLVVDATSCGSLALGGSAHRLAVDAIVRCGSARRCSCAANRLIAA